MQLNLAGQVAIVTGAGSGIGLATVDALIGEGARVAGVDLKTGALEGRDNVLAVQLDLMASDAGNEVAQRTIEAYGKIDILVNAVGGGAPQPDRFAVATDDDWRRTFELNLFPMVRVTRAVIPHMVSGGRGAILSVASDEALQPSPDFPDYSAAKAAVMNVSKSLSKQYGPQRIRSNVVLPGFIRTPLTEPFFNHLKENMGMGEEAAEKFILEEVKRTALPHIGHPDDVARLIVFLVSDAAEMITGGAYRVDSGSIAAV